MIYVDDVIWNWKLYNILYPVAQQQINYKYILDYLANIINEKLVKKLNIPEESKSYYKYVFRRILEN